MIVFVKLLLKIYLFRGKIHFRKKTDPGTVAGVHSLGIRHSEQSEESSAFQDLTGSFGFTASG